MFILNEDFDDDVLDFMYEYFNSSIPGEGGSPYDFIIVNQRKDYSCAVIEYCEKYRNLKPMEIQEDTERIHEEYLKIKVLIAKKFLNEEAEMSELMQIDASEDELERIRRV